MLNSLRNLSVSKNCLCFKLMSLINSQDFIKKKKGNTNIKKKG